MKELRAIFPRAWLELEVRDSRGKTLLKRRGRAPPISISDGGQLRVQYIIELTYPA